MAVKEILIAVGLLALGVLVALLQPSVPTIPFQTVAFGEESGVKSWEALVITAQEQWQELWVYHASYSRHPPPPPEIDFSREMVIALFGGIQPEGSLLQIAKVEKRQDRLVVRYTDGGLSCSKCSLPRGMVQPFHIVRLERTDLPVAFSRD